MKPALPRRRVWRAAIFLGSLALITVAADMLFVEWRRPIHPGYDTTRITAPLMADGSVDYLTALEEHFSHGVTRENNAAPLILQALGRNALPKSQPVDGITDRLGMEHLPEKGDYFIPYTSAYFNDKNGEDSDLDDANLPQHWPIKLRTNAAKWVKDNEKPLALLAEASRRPRYFLPFNGGNRPEILLEIQLPHVKLLRESSKALMVRALLRLDAGDAAGFHEDMLAALRLARLLGQAPTLVERVVAANTIEVPACHVIRLAAQNGKLPPDEARAILNEMIALGDLPSITHDAINNGERYLILDILQSMSRGGPGRATELFKLAVNDNTGTGGLFRFVPVQYDRTMERMNHFYDGALAALNESSYPDKAAALKLWNDEVEKIAKGNHTMTFLTSDWPLLLFLPAITKPDNKWDVARMQNELTRAALALSIYHAEHNAYPRALLELAPKYIPAVPDDFFVEKPLIYSRTADGYTLYSVGPNMIDDSGKSTGPGDDIVASSNIVANK